MSVPVPFAYSFASNQLHPVCFASNTLEARKWFNVARVSAPPCGFTCDTAGCIATAQMICRNEETTVPGVFGIGDAVEDVPELTPSAIQAGRLLARRLFGGGNHLLYTF